MKAASGEASPSSYSQSSLDTVAHAAARARIVVGLNLSLPTSGLAAIHPKSRPILLSLSFSVDDTGKACQANPSGGRRVDVTSEGKSQQGGAARQTRRRDRQEHADAFARSSGERRSADINALVEESLNLAYHGARAERADFRVNLKRDFDPDAGTLDLYPHEITRALLNLISNGFYSATKRKVQVMVRSSPCSV
jgi:hypothetical protein